MRTPKFPKIELLCGMIASGKSTYARERADEGALVISHDGLTEMLHAQYRYEPELRDTYRRMEEAIVRLAIEASRDTVIDRTHLTRESRARWVQFARSLKVPILVVRFPRFDAETHASRRFEADPRGRPLDDWLKVARHHADQADADPLEWWAEGFGGILRIKKEVSDAHA